MGGREGGREGVLRGYYTYNKLISFSTFLIPLFGTNELHGQVDNEKPLSIVIKCILVFICVLLNWLGKV